MGKTAKDTFDKIRKPLAPPTKRFASKRDYCRRNYLPIDSKSYCEYDEETESGEYDGETW